MRKAIVDKLSKSKGFDFAKKYYLNRDEPNDLFDAKVPPIGGTGTKDAAAGDKVRSGVLDQTDEQIRDMIRSPEGEQRAGDASPVI